MPSSTNSSIRSTPIPARPTLGRHQRPDAEWNGLSALRFPARRWTSSGRAAIALALIDAGLAPGDEVLVPEYNCPSMVDPVVLLGLSPVFYSVDGRFAPAYDSLRALVGPRTRAMMLTHFFGVPQDGARARAFCDDSGLILIEDCAHAFFGNVGSEGDYACFSLTKFFPVYEGGLLASARRGLERVRPMSPGLPLELKSVWWAYEHAAAFGRRPLGSMVFRSARAVRAALRGRTPGRAASPIGPAAAEGASGLEQSWVDRRCSVFTRLVTVGHDAAANAGRRREVWSSLHQALSSIPGVRPVVGTLGEGTVPYVLAVTVDREPEGLYRRLKAAGVPVYRWDSPHLALAAQGRREADRLARIVFQFPVHQSLTDAEVGAIARQMSVAAHEVDSNPAHELRHAH